MEIAIELHKVIHIFLDNSRGWGLDFWVRVLVDCIIVVKAIYSIELSHVHGGGQGIII